MKFKDPVYRNLYEEMKNIRQAYTPASLHSGLHGLPDTDFYRKRIRSLSQKSLMVWLALAGFGMAFLFHLIIALQAGNMLNSSASFWGGWIFLAHFSLQQLNLSQKLKELRHGQKLLDVCQMAYSTIPKRR
ncbi:MAG: hypothetical protein AAFR61_24075 [Bacteroidota bacterium]